MLEENKTIELEDKELEKVAGGDDEAITFFKKDFTFNTFEGETYHVCQDTVVYSLHQIVRAYRSVNEPWDSSSFFAGEIMQFC